MATPPLSGRAGGCLVQALNHWATPADRRLF